MKHHIINYKAIIVAVLLALPMLMVGQIQVGSDTTLTYGFICNEPSDYGQPKDIDSVFLYSLPTDLFVKKSTDADRETVENFVKSYLPDASFNWYNKSGACCITTDSVGLDEAIIGLRSKDEIACVSKAYIRKDFKDIYDLYPIVGEIQIMGFGDMLAVYYLNDETKDKAIDLINTMGLTFENPDNHIYSWEYVFVPKSMDVLTVAQQLFRSGHFLIVIPMMMGVSKDFGVQQIDYSKFQFYYGKNGGIQYLYPTPNVFGLRKSLGTTINQMESIIKSHTENNCNITWVNADYCIVRTNRESVNTAKMTLMDLDEVMWVSEGFLDEPHYKRSLSYIYGKLTYWGLDGRLTVSFNEGVSETVKNEIINGYGLSLISNDTINDRIYHFNPDGTYYRYDTIYYYSRFELQKKADILSVCRSIYETGQVEYILPTIVKEWESGRLILDDGNSNATEVKEKNAEIEELYTQYYDLLGRRIDTPSGLMIVVTRYSDGTIRTEKKLF